MSVLSNHKSIRRIAILCFAYAIIAICVVTSSGIGNGHNMSHTGVAVGKKVWQRNNCVVCHSVYGLGGHMGPDLTNVFSRKGSAYIRTIVRQGNQKMPAYALSESDEANLISYFEYLDSLGKYPLESVENELFGVHKNQH